ncbi:phage shock protein C (PspC) family protein [Edaphobacter aggregans]|uniref:Phage shock protein C (PspC) family protein n=1 Tax=Edaphobacter aggregans TaxID=570835 RepID=A0A428MDG2_9BACT|nr:PspC domain-containing protein [Edaphobacter aggregans]RSL14889.1 phage shock protein C (PspC) family protein [Edaphobacter aggregans]
MFCTHCGNKLDPSSRFCPACGTSVPLAATPFVDLFSSTGKLVRPRLNRMVAGVCVAFAQQYGWDLTVVRIVTALLIVLTGVGALAYIAAWVIIPEEPLVLPTKSI